MNKLIFLVFILLLMSCSGSKMIKLATQGELLQEAFDQEVPMHYLDGHIYIEAKIDGVVYTFLFDTGYDVTTLNHDLLENVCFEPVKKQSTSGSSFEETRLQYGLLCSTFTMGEIDFRNFGVGFQNLSHIQSPFSDGRKIDGIIGVNLLKSAFWQIDYQKQILRFSDKIENFQLSSDARPIHLIPKGSSNWGLRKINVTMNGLTDDFILDTGSSGSFSANFSFMESLQNVEEPLLEISNESDYQKKKFKMEEVKIDSLACTDQVLSIEENIGLLIGNDFLEHFLVTIDWMGNKLYLQNLDN